MALLQICTMPAENLIDALKIIFAKYGIPHKVMSDADTNFISEKF